MQKIGIGIIIILICLLTRCTTVKGGLSSYEPTAIVSIMSNKVINWEGEEERVEGVGDSFIRNIILPKQTANKVTQSTADELIEEAATIMFDSLTLAEIATIVPPADVLETQAYFRAKPNMRVDSGDYVKPMAYKFINNADKDLAINLAQEEGIKSTLYLDFTFNKKLANSFMKSGTMIAQVIMRVTLLDENGKKLYFKSHEYWSPNKIEVVSAAYVEDELMELFREALYEAAVDLVMIMSGN
jgi:hypothetical protein